MPAEKLTTKQAQDRAGVSRHALMRAKKKGLLFAEADNQGNLLWAVSYTHLTLPTNREV